MELEWNAEPDHKVFFNLFFLDRSVSTNITQGDAFLAN